jgi:hypothetical protein
MKLNKIVLYVGLAILLGTVTMVAPLALLNDNNSLSDDKFLVKTTSAPLDNQTREYSNDSKTLGLDSTSGSFTAIPPSEPDPTESDVLPEEPQAIFDVTSGDSTTDLSPVALITVPSFLIALGIFVFLRRQVS